MLTACGAKHIAKPTLPDKPVGLLQKQKDPPPPATLNGLTPEQQASVVTREYMALLEHSGRVDRLLDSLQQWVESLYEERENGRSD